MSSSSHPHAQTHVSPPAKLVYAKKATEAEAEVDVAAAGIQGLGKANVLKLFSLLPVSLLCSWPICAQL